jgi:pyruvate,water dikinase
MKYIFRPNASQQAVDLGSKAGSLAKLHAYGLMIPEWFVILPEACDLSFPEPDRRGVSHQDPSPNAENIPIQIAWTPGARQELEQALAEFCRIGEPVAVRSSATEEDGPEHSFAGQLDSFLSVRPQAVAEKIEAVWRSAFKHRAKTYRDLRRVKQPPRAPAVLIQRMIDSEVAGVAFGADPVSGREDLAVVSAIRGLGVALVNGDCNADTWHIDASGNIVQRKLAHDCPVLDDIQIRAVADLARRTGRIFGRPQDIEWAIAEGVLHLLQSRPITSCAIRTPLTIWDNSNIVESYSGVTTPLTFSFAQRAYAGVYRQFCRILAVPKAKIAAHDQTFRHMLGLIRGRVYYHLLNWYRVLALLPGFTLNHRFMEQMMGVKEGLPAEILAELGQASLGRRLKDALNLAFSLAALAANHLCLSRKIRRFYSWLEAALAPPSKPLEAMTAAELLDYFRELERKLLTRWDAPLLNDFFAMIFYGILRSLVTRWAHDSDATLQNGLLCDARGMISAEPARRIRELANLASGDRHFVKLLRDAPLPDIFARLPELPQFNSAYREYISKFGERCLEELKLESLTLHDDPLLLFRSVGRLADALVHGTGLSPAPDVTSQRLAAEARVNELLSSHPLGRVVFRWVLGRTRARLRDRENLRFERTRLYARIRRIFLELGQRLAAQGSLREARDVFYLELDELLSLTQGNRSPTNFMAIVADRKTEFTQFQNEESPPNRFTTRGAAPAGRPLPAGPVRQEPTPGDSRKGIGSCPGFVRGRVRKMNDPRKDVLRTGEILVAERTDPGWVILFPSIAGLLVERGSLLSHSAIVAREMGIPAIVCIDGLTAWLDDGDLVEFNGATGQVWRIDAVRLPEETLDESCALSAVAS